jgi:hypothetical protein
VDVAFSKISDSNLEMVVALRVDRPVAQRFPATGTGDTNCAACTITSATACGCEAMIACEPWSSVTLALARCAIERMMSVAAPTSSVATIAQDGSV